MGVRVLRPEKSAPRPTAVSEEAGDSNNDVVYANLCTRRSRKQCGSCCGGARDGKRCVAGAPVTTGARVHTEGRRPLLVPILLQEMNMASAILVPPLRCLWLASPENYPYEASACSPRQVALSVSLLASRSLSRHRVWPEPATDSSDCACCLIVCRIVLKYSLL